MEGALDTIESTYGGIDSYLTGHAGMAAATVEQLRRALVAHAPRPT
jgi:hypothetical protein